MQKRRYGMWMAVSEKGAQDTIKKIKIQPKKVLTLIFFARIFIH